MSFGKVRNAHVYSLVDEIIDEEEFEPLFDTYKYANPSYPYWEYDGFCLDSFESCECLTEFNDSIYNSTFIYLFLAARCAAL